ncbi:DNA repair endonuclease XPF-like [Penaeus chinensis]|uniref:DNA repair endonuclease XPF-like n=1 Tax=Penaeus chinensis TaxID=139456 RepID=UPI001FB7A0B9|nr:DNA repair endonuclease XPF-like [Penaeus chinensis]XP_047494473.1 DNA repair endonuclease XPF-like [Penaeus chinensis]
MLEYENQMLLDLLHEDGLLVAAKGLGLERILISLIITYNDPGNLVLVIGTTSREEEYLLSQLEGQGVTPIPRCVTAECSVNERSQIYANGGVLFVTSRILVMDILMERAPVDLITGVIVWKAHKILESCQEAFILRLFRMKNKTGFVKGLSSSPLSFTAGFCHVERVMRNLFVKKLYLWPRFHMDVNACLEKCKPEVIELHLKMTTPVQQIQMAVLELITETVQELRRSNSTIDTEEFTPENAISKSFEKILKVQLEPIWHQLSSRTKMLIADLKVMRTVLLYLTQYDCVTFYNLVNSLRTTETAIQSSGWMFLGAAETLFVNSKLRVFGIAASPTKKSVREDNAKKLKKEYIDQNLEVNPKWLALSEVLAEVREEVQEGKNLEKCLVVTHDDRTSQQLKEYLIDGAQVVLRRIFYRTIGAKMGLQPPPNLFRDKDKNMQKDKGKKGKKTKTTEEAKEEVTLTQITKKYDFIGQDKSEFSNEAETSEEVEEIRRRFLSPLIMVQSLRDNSDPFMMTRLLEEVQPKYIIMYDSDLTFIRQIEVWQANHIERIRVYFLLYKGTTEEQVYLTNIKREKDAFEYLINEKATMVIPEYNDGKSGDHPDLSRDPRKANEIDTSGNSNTRKGGQGEELKVPQRIIVDMREFRSELPALIHKRGIDIDPVTIEVGDYILTPDVCVERKSLSDLIGSLNSGRLYNQAQAMTRYYKKPILLIEFDQNKSFHLQGRFFLSSDASSSAKDIAAKLQLLTLHFPHLRLLWCPSPYATAEIFQLLKEGKEEPVVAQAQAITAETNPEVDSDKFNPQIKDFISKLPGITTKNIYSVLNKVSDLSELLSLSKEELTEILGNSRNAQALYSGLHHCMKPPEKEELKKGSKFTKKGLKRFRTKM